MTRPLEIGIELVERYGLSIFPLAERSKVPAVEGGRNAHTRDVAKLREFMERRPDCNYGIATGSDAGGLFVIDCDVDDDKGEDGIATVRAWENGHGDLPEGPVTTTPRGGMHIWFLSPDEPVKCSTNAELGVDVRGDGGYIVGPGSVLDNGTYEWDMDIADYAIPNADERVRALLSHVQRGARGEREKFKLPDVIGPGERNDVLFRYACSLRADISDETLIAASVLGINATLCKPPLTDMEVEKIVRSACSYEAGKSVEVAARSSAGKMLARTKNGNPLPTIDNCMTVLCNDPRVAGRWSYDVIGYSKMVTPPLPWDNGTETRAVTDVDYSQLAAWLEREYRLSAKGAAIDAVTNVCHDNRRNPVVEWLDSLKWDGKPRVDTLLPFFLGADRNEYTDGATRLFMRGAVARAYEPGCKFDVMLVLEGKQGIGKSEFLRKLAHDPRWFNDNFNTVDGDAAVEKLRGMWIVEMAELLASKRTQDVEAVKAFVTSRVDTIRPKYGRETEQRKRCCVIAGTTNDMQFLSDPTGNRRFLPVHCGATKPSDALYHKDAQKWIDQAWAEVVHEWKAGMRDLRLPEELLETADGMRDRYVEDDPRVGMIQSYLDDLVESTCDPASLRVCAVEILERVLEVRDARNAPKKTVKEVHQIMTNRVAGWQRYDGNATGKLRTNWGIQVCYVPKLE